MQIILGGSDDQKPSQRPHTDIYTVATFDTAQEVFLTKEAPVPRCISGVLLPSPSDMQVQVLCGGTNSVHFLQPASGGAATLSSSLQLPPGIDKRRLSVSTGIRFTNGGSFAIMKDGRILEIDGNAKKVARISVNNWLADKWVPERDVHSSPDGTRLYVAVGRLADRSTGKAYEIHVFDTKTWQLLKTITTSRSYWNIAISHDGLYLYAIDPDSQSLSVIDTTHDREIKTISGIGSSPVRAVVAP